MRFNILYLIPVVISFLSIQTYSSLTFSNYPFWVVVQITTIYYLYKSKQKTLGNSINSENKYIYLYLYYSLANSLIGIFFAEDYWEWKGLLTVSLVYFMPLVAFLAFDPDKLKLFFRGYIFIAIPLFPIVFLFSNKSAYGYYLALIPLFFIGLPYLNINSKISLVLLTLIVLTAEFAARSNVIKFTIPVFLISLYYIKNKKSLMNFLRLSMLGLPIIFFTLAATNQFNIFKFDEYIDSESTTARVVDGEVIIEDLKADTRTQLYAEVISSASKHNSWIFGRTPAKGNETDLFSDLANITGKTERLSNEVSILNIFTRMGLVGVVLYGLLFARASWLAINKSNNNFCQIIGLFVAFRWLYAWIEDFDVFNINYMMIWIMIGICFSKTLRNMDENQIKEWLRNIFSLRITRNR